MRDIHSNIVLIRVLAVLIIVAYSTTAKAYVNTQFKNFSQPEPIVRTATKAVIIESEPEAYDPGDALIWRAPPYQPLAKSLNAQEENRRKQEALTLLINAAYETNTKLADARSKLKRKQISELGAQIIGKTTNLDSSESERYIRSAINEISREFTAYSQSYYKTSREPEWLERIESARAYLIYNCSQEALSQVDKIYLGDNYETTTNTLL